MLLFRKEFACSVFYPFEIKGMNKILIKVVNRSGDSGFYFRVTDEGGNHIPALEFVSANSLI